MNISLTPELEEMVRRKVESGMYNSASEVIREALRFFSEQEQIREQRLEELRREIQIVLDSIKEGGLVDGEEAFRVLRQMSEERRRQSK